MPATLEDVVKQQKRTNLIVGGMLVLDLAILVVAAKYVFG